jgi:hypothetical protein
MLRYLTLGNLLKFATGIWLLKIIVLWIIGFFTKEQGS